MWRILLVITGVIMSFQLIGGDTSNTSAIVNQVNQNIAQLKVQDVTNIFKDDTGTRRVLLGKGKNDFYGLKVSQAGTDVYDGADEDMVFNSDNNLFKIVASGTTTIQPSYTVAPTTAAGTYTATVAHGLGYAPVFLAFVKPPDSYNVSNGLLPWIKPVSGEVFIMASGDTDETNVTFTLYQRSNTDYSPDDPIYTFKYYLLQETAN